MKTSFNIACLSQGIFLCLLLSELAFAQLPDSVNVHAKYGRIINLETKKGIKAGVSIRANVPIPKGDGSRAYNIISTSYLTQEKGFYSIAIDRTMDVRNIKVKSIEGFEIRNIKDNNDIEVVPRKVITREYLLKVEDVAGQVVPNAYFVLSDNEFQLKGATKFRYPAIFPDPMPLQIKVNDLGAASGTFTLYKKGSGRDKPKLYWTREKKEEVIAITFKLPLRKTHRKYLVKNREGIIFKNYPMKFTHNQKLTYTDQEGHLETKMFLTKADLTLAKGKVDRVDAQEIVVDAPLYDLNDDAKKKDALRKGIHKLDSAKVRWKEKAEALQKRIDSFIRQDSLSPSKAKVLSQQLDHLNHEIQHGLKEVKALMITALVEDTKLRQQLIGSDTTLAKIGFNDLKNLIKRISREKKRTQKSLYISIIVGLMSILILVLWYLKRSKHANFKIRSQKDKLDTQVILLYEQKKQLDDQVTQLNSQDNLIKLLLSEMKHRVGNHLVSIQSKVSLINRKISDVNAKAHLAETKAHIQKLINVQQSLNYSFATKEQTDILFTDDIKAKLHNIASSLFDFHFDEENRPQINITISLTQLIKSRFTLIAFCVFELINNACKYALKKNNGTTHQVDVQLTKDQTFVTLLVASTGRGITPDLFKEGEFLFDQVGPSRGMNIVKKITEVESGNFKVFTAGVHEALVEGSKFECSFKY